MTSSESIRRANKMNMPRIGLPVKHNARLGLQHTFHPIILAQGRVSGRSGLARRGFPLGHEQTQGLCRRREGELCGDDFEELCYACTCIAEEFDTGWVGLAVIVVGVGRGRGGVRRGC